MGPGGEGWGPALILRWNNQDAWITVCEPLNARIHPRNFYATSFRTTSFGIGVFFDTRKGSFRYKISLYIITYHVAIIVYHCVSLSISQYIMSLGDT
jgi:hypothetical protein